MKTAHRSIFPSAAIVACATMISRVTGFIRDVCIAAILGAGPLADIFVIAFRLPNLFRRLFAEGALHAAFIPLFTAKLKEGGKEVAQKFAVEVFSFLFFALLFFTALIEMAMPFVLHLIAHGFAQIPEKFELAVLYSRIAFPYLFFMSLMAICAAILNASGRFLIAAATPILLNVILIAALALSVSLSANPAWFLIWGVSFAGLLQFLCLLWAVRFVGYRLPIRFPRITPSLRNMLWLGIPGVLAAGVVQINLLIGTNIASQMESAAAWLYYADRLYQLPLGVIGVAVGIALLPMLSHRLASGDMKGAFHVQNRAIEAVCLFGLPASVGLFMLAEPIIHILFERAQFTPQDTIATAEALAAFAPGLIAFILIKILQPCFFARKNTHAPLWHMAFGVVVNISVSLYFFPRYGHLAIAWATSLAGWVTLVLSWVSLQRRKWLVITPALIWRVCFILIACVAMTLILLSLIPFFSPFFFAEGWISILALLGIIMTAASIYFSLLLLFRVVTIDGMYRNLLGK